MPFLSHGSGVLAPRIARGTLPTGGACANLTISFWTSAQILAPKAMMKALGRLSLTRAKNGEPGVIGSRPTPLPIGHALSAGANTPPHTARLQMKWMCSKMCSEMTPAQEVSIKISKNI